MRGDYRFLLTGKIDRHLYYRLESSIAGLRIACDGGLDGRLRVAGWIEAETRARAEDLARSLGLADRVEFTGAYTQEQAPAIYRSADAYVMTKHNDPCPNSVLEALASGLPILYSDSGGVPELASAEAGVALHCPEDWETTRAPTPAAIGDGMLKIAAASRRPFRRRRGGARSSASTSAIGSIVTGPCFNSWLRSADVARG
jgi:glycosyltransferase involved in cell wall biosynthesis